MIRFNELRITNDGKTLIIDAQVKDDPNYENVYIKNIKVDTQDNYENGFSCGPTTDAPIVWESTDTPTKRVNIALQHKDVFNDEHNNPCAIPTLNNHLFFVYVTVVGEPSVSTPCGCDNETTLGITMYLGDFYNTFMSYIREMNNGDCSVPQGLIDLLLRFKALNISMDAGHYQEGLNYYNKWFSGKNVVVRSTSNCGCHG